MKRENRNSRSRAARRTVLVALTIATLGVIGCVGMMMGHSGVTKPPSETFGQGPRMSDRGLYHAMIESSDPLRPRRMQSVIVAVQDADGHPVDGAAIEIDGGMPQHGHGLPTRPRVTRALGEGRYQVEGLRFNMGGWWEFRVSIDAPSGLDRITFNLEI